MTINSIEMHTPKVSIVVRTKNESTSLPILLTKLKTQTFKNFEVIVVDDHSQDGTVAIARKFGCKVIPLNMKFSYGRSLNKGIAAAKGDYIVSIAAHAVPVSDTYLADFIQCLESNPKYAGVYGAQIADGANFLEKAERTINSKFPFNWFYPYFINTNSIFKKEVWEQVKFSDAVWGLEDNLWCRTVAKKKYRFSLCKQAVVYHHHDKSILATLVRYYKEGKVFVGILLGRYK